MRRSLAISAAALLVAPLSGCFFIFIPGSVIDKVVGAPKWCVSTIVKVGDRITLNGAPATITKIHGPSDYYCRNSPPDRQIGADAEWVAQAPMPASQAK